jgi:hypothetical protein
MLPRRLLIVLAMLGRIHSAHAHGIAGNRFFPGTLSFDDPAVADEAIVPNFSSFKRPGDAGNIVDNRFDWAFFRLLTPTLGVGVDGAWVHRNWGSALRSGSEVISLGLKGEVYRNDLHEVLVSARLDGASGTQGLKESAPMHPTRSSLGFFSAKVSVIFRTGWHGCGRSALPARSRSTTR